MRRSGSHESDEDRRPGTDARDQPLPCDGRDPAVWSGRAGRDFAVYRTQPDDGLGVGLQSVCLTATAIGYGLAANLPPLLGAAILLLTPLAFLLSTARNCRQLADVVALALGLALFPIVSLLHTGVDILISGVSAGTIAYGVHWWRERV